MGLGNGQLCGMVKASVLARIGVESVPLVGVFIEHKSPVFNL
jgi:hypothetical protein